MKRIFGISIILVVAIVTIVFFVFSKKAQAPKYEAEVKGQTETLAYQPKTENVLSTSTEKSSKETVLIFGGDVMLSRVVGQKMEKHKDFTWPFKKVAEVMKNADYTVINLESPFTYGKSHYVPTGSFSFNADPQAIAGLKSAGIDLVSLANNHFGNQGKKGMMDTFKILSEAGIKFVGAGNNSSQAHDFKKQNINGLDFCFLAYAYPDDLYIAGSSTPGMANMDINLMKKDMVEAKKSCDKIIVQMHSGIEYVNKPNSQQKNFAHVAIDAGADLVVGHHPHWVQVTEIYKGKPILYSLGNLLFDQMWSKETAQGALAKVVFNGDKIEKIEIVPIEIKDYGQPVLANKPISDEILKRMGLKSNTLSF